MESAELGVVKAKETRKMLKEARPQRQLLQAFDRRHEGELYDAETSTV